MADAAGLERTRLLRWIVAWTGLSAAWFLGDGCSAAIDLRVAELGRCGGGPVTREPA